MDNAEIQIFNPLGQFISKKKVESAQVILDLGSFATGVYYLKIKTSKGQVVKKVVLQQH